MSDRVPRISRRRLLQLASITPLVALAESGASTAALAQAAQECAGISEDDMRELVGIARAYYETAPGKKLPETKFRLVACVLWQYYCEGARPEAEVPAPGVELTELLVEAYNKTGKKNRRCGDLIVDNLDKWDVFQHEPRTNACAFRAGCHSKKYAKDNGANKPKKVDKDAFRKGWDDAESDMCKSMSRLGWRKCGTTTEDGEAGNRGFGC